MSPPAYILHDFKNVSQKNICRSFSNFAIETFGAKQFFPISKKLQHEETGKIRETWFSPLKTTSVI